MLPARRLGITPWKSVSPARRTANVAALAMLSFIVISQAGGGERRVPGSEGPAAPNPPNVPSVNVTPTDTSALVTSTAFSGDAGDTHDSTMWRIRKQSNGSTVLEITVGDSLTSYQGNGLGYTVPLQTDTAYDVAASHHGSVSGEWSGYGPAQNFTAAASEGTIVFASDWGTGTGTNSNVFRDVDGEYGSWEVVGSSTSGAIVSVVDSLGLTSPGFDNCFLINTGSANRVRHDGTLAELAVGDTRNYRVYFARLNDAVTNPTSGSWHPADLFETGGDATPGSDDWFKMFALDYISNGTVTFQHNVTTVLDNYDAGAHFIFVLTDSLGSEVQFAADRLWGREIRLSRTSTDTVLVTDAWVYDDTGATAYGPGDHFLAGDRYSLASGDMPMVASTISFDNWRLGTNGFPPEEGPYDGSPWACWGGVAIVDNVDQIGPWNGSY